MSLRIEGLERVPVIAGDMVKHSKTMLLSELSTHLYSIEHMIGVHGDGEVSPFTEPHTFEDSSPLPPHFDYLVKNKDWVNVDKAVSSKLAFDTAVELSLPLILTIPVSHLVDETYVVGEFSGQYILHLNSVLDSASDAKGTFKMPISLLPTVWGEGVAYGHNPNVHRENELRLERSTSSLFQHFLNPDSIVFAGGDIGERLASSSAYFSAVPSKELFVLGSYSEDGLLRNECALHKIEALVSDTDLSDVGAVHQLAAGLKRHYNVCQQFEEFKILGEHTGVVDRVMKLSGSKLL